MLIEELPGAFTLKEALNKGISKDKIYSLLENGEIDRAGRGVYLQYRSIDPSLAPLSAATAIHTEATLCLTSALVYHKLTDAIPFGSNIALPRGIHHPAGFKFVSWHSFDPRTFHIGRELFDLGTGQQLAIYSAERTIIDIFRLMHTQGSDVAHEALKRWLQAGTTTPAELLRIAKSFPKALPKIRFALEVLL